MRTGLYFGSFNPFHKGHLAIANYIVDFTEVDEIWFVVSPQNPLKDKDSLAPDHHRLEMVKRAIPFNENRMMVCDIEMSMPRPSYTVDTIKELKIKYPNRTFYIILGSDSMDSITKWKDYDDLLYNNKILIYPREGSNTDELTKKYPIKIINAPLVNYSSTQIRQLIMDGENVQCYLPEYILEYINDLGLYRTKP
ncbi:MAG: nicotinate-nucleotide adenylyltransferase [Bacteroidales bacterium]|nr:MAG: nicotinate-nucleotide adenylyltransferase [Bacteroidales bacterium]